MDQLHLFSDMDKMSSNLTYARVHLTLRSGGYVMLAKDR